MCAADENLSLHIKCHTNPCASPSPRLPALPSAADTTGTSPLPDPRLVAQLANLSCNATDQWVVQLPAAVAAGGVQAQAAVVAFNQSTCDVMQPIVASLFGDNENFTAVKE